MNKYCPDCGGALLNPKRCGCGWSQGKTESVKESLYPECCMVAGCKSNTVVVIHSRGGPITRCAWHYTEDLRHANKHQFAGKGAA